LGLGQPITPTLHYSNSFTFMLTESVNLDLADLTPDQQVGRLKEQYVFLRGKGAVVRARVSELPVRQYISMLERGYRVVLEREGESFVLVLRPDGSTPRLGLRGAHSVLSHPDGRVYTNTTDNRVAVIDASTRRVKKHIETGDDPSHLEFSHDGKRLYVANSGSNDVTIIDTTNDQVFTTASTGRRPLLPCVAANGKAVYLPSGPDRDVTVLSGDGEFRAKLPVGAAPHDAAVSPDSRWAYQPNSASHTVTVIDGRNYSVIGEVRVGLGPGHIVFDPESRFAYVANTVSNDVTVISTNNHEVVASIPAGNGAHLPALSPDGRFGYVADFASDDLTVWDCSNHRVIATIPVGIYPHFFAISPDGKWIVVSNTGESSICIIDARANETRARLAVAAAPAHLAFSPDNELAFVGCESTDEVAVIDLRRQTVVELIKAGQGV
jgi:YVTN family beta-propeller protein